jgi:fucose permease
VFLSVGLEVAFGGWTTVYATRWLGQSEADGHALTSAYWGAFTAGRVAAAAAAAALSPSALLLASMPLALAGGAAAIALPPAALAGAPATAAVVLVGLGVSTGFANLLALLEAYSPINGSVTGLLSGFAGAGTMLMPLAIALLAKSTPLGYSGLMWTTLVAMLLQFVCLLPIMTGAGAHKSGVLVRAHDVSIPPSEAGGGGGGGSGEGGDTEEGLGGAAPGAAIAAASRR